LSDDQRARGSGFRRPWLYIAGVLVLILLAVARETTREIDPRQPAATSRQANSKAGKQGIDPAVPVPPDADEARRAAIAAAFDALQASRKSLQISLGELKARLWGVELPAGQARAITRDMMTAQYLLKDPPMLGAFSDVRGVHAEKERVDTALATLRRIEASLDADAAAGR
jgi:hypothetical protein